MKKKQTDVDQVDRIDDAQIAQHVVDGKAAQHREAPQDEAGALAPAATGLHHAPEHVGNQQDRNQVIEVL